jgi:trk system potassium uptake protein TrkH
MIAFAFYFSALGAILCASTLIPALIAFGVQEIQIGYRILLYGASGGFFCIATLLAIHGRLGGMERNTAIILAVTSWIGFPAVTALPLSDLLNISYIDAVFQTMSAFTTSGAMIIENVDTMPRSVLFMLAQFQWLGGAGVLITLVLVLAPWEIGGLPQVSSASVAASIVASQSRLVKFCWRIFRAYLMLTLMCFIGLLLCQVKPFDAMVLSFSALSTGGMSPTDQSIDLVIGNWGMIILAAFMITGATSVFWHESVARLNIEDLRAHRESYFILAVWLALALYVAYKISVSTGETGFLLNTKALSEGVFNSASIISTSGLQSRPGVFSLLPSTLVLMLIFIGGGCYSTSGGIKFFRIGGMFSLSEYELNRLIYPSSMKPTRFGNTKFDLGIMKAIWSLFAVLIITVAIATCALSITGIAFQPSLTAVIAAITNSGSVYTPDWSSTLSNQWPAYFDMSDIQKFILTVTMFLGRLEVISVFACATVVLRTIRQL